MAVTNLQDIARQPEEVELPPYPDGATLTVLIKPLELMTLVRVGIIPNELLARVYKAEVKKENPSIKDGVDLYYKFAEKSLVEPTMKELEEVNRDLTIDQLKFIFNYFQKGVLELEDFRTDGTVLENSQSDGDDTDTSERNNGDNG